MNYGLRVSKSSESAIICISASKNLRNDDRLFFKCGFKWKKSQSTQIRVAWRVGTPNPHLTCLSKFLFKIILYFLSQKLGLMFWEAQILTEAQTLFTTSLHFPKVQTLARLTNGCQPSSFSYNFNFDLFFFLTLPMSPFTTLFCSPPMTPLAPLFCSLPLLPLISLFYLPLLLPLAPLIYLPLTSFCVVVHLLFNPILVLFIFWLYSIAPSPDLGQFRPNS